MKQKRYAKNRMLGKFDTKKAAALDAGYSEKYATHRAKSIERSRGYKRYLKEIQTEAEQIYGMTIEEKMAQVSMEGLNAVRTSGRGQNRREVADHSVRLKYLKNLEEIFKWKDRGEGVLQKKGGKYQFNFFSVDPEEKKDFDKTFKQFLKNQTNEDVQKTKK